MELTSALLAYDEVISQAAREGRTVTTADKLRAMKAAIEAYEVARGAGWIDSLVKLPISDEFVWASWAGAGNWHHDARQGLARYVDGLGWQPQQSMGWDWNITHWMPLPPMPDQSEASRFRAPGGITSPKKDSDAR